MYVRRFLTMNPEPLGCIIISQDAPEWRFAIMDRDRMWISEGDPWKVEMPPIVTLRMHVVEDPDWDTPRHVYLVDPDQVALLERVSQFEPGPKKAIEALFEP